MALRALIGLIIVVALSAASGLTFGWKSPITITVELVATGAMLAGNHWGLRRIDRWYQGAVGERAVGAVLDRLAPEGWITLHDLDSGRGNTDHVAIGPGGIFTVETKSHRRPIKTSDVDPRMLAQAYAQKKALEAAIGQPVEPLLVFSQAYLVDRPISRRKGVVILTARVLASYLRRQPARLRADEVAAISERLAKIFAGGDDQSG